MNWIKKREAARPVMSVDEYMMFGKKGPRGR